MLFFSDDRIREVREGTEMALECDWIQDSSQASVWDAVPWNTLFFLPFFGYPKLPSISTLLTLPSPPSPPQIVVDDSEPPSFSLSPASPRPSACNNMGLKSPFLSVALSPLLSPIESPGSSSRRSLSPLLSPSLLSPTSSNSNNHFNNNNNNNHTNNNISLPPLQGDDPPRKLQRHPSISSISSITTSPKPQYNSVWSSSSPSTTPFMTSPRQSTIESPVPSFLPSPIIPDATNTATTYTTRSVSPCSSMDEDGPVLLRQHHTQERDTGSSSGHSSSNSSHSDLNEKPALPPSMQIVLSESGQPILKRRRGRPPSMREPALEGGWTFLTPTVWDVNNPQSQHDEQQQQQQQQQSKENDHTETPESIMNGSMAAFTSSNMDMVLQMPRKKRGRKPKTHIAGNSCFVWKEITASRRTKKSKQKPTTTLRRLEQAPSESTIA